MSSYFFESLKSGLFFICFNFDNTILNKDYQRDFSCDLAFLQKCFMHKNRRKRLIPIYISKAVLRYNPIVHIMNRASNSDMELCCDQDVIQNKDKEFCNLYSDIIMDNIVETRKFKGAVMVCMGSNKKNAEIRFLSIFNKNKKKWGDNFYNCNIINHFFRRVCFF